MGPLSHSPGHLIVGVAALAATLLVSSITRNRLVRHKLRLSVFLLAGYILVNLILAFRDTALPISDPQLRSLEQLALAAALINLFVVSLINPLRADRVPDAFPSILQDAMVIGTLVLVATFVFEDKLLTTSAVSAVVVGFALQDTLGNAFAGLAIQSEKPFRVGHWIKVGDFEGRVSEVTWRATKLRTKSGNFIVLPNNQVSQQAITNFSEPAVPTRLELDVGASYMSTPAAVKAALMEAFAQVPRVLKAPAPDALVAHGTGDFDPRQRARVGGTVRCHAHIAYLRRRDRIDALRDDAEPRELLVHELPAIGAAGDVDVIDRDLIGGERGHGASPDPTKGMTMRLRRSAA